MINKAMAVFFCGLGGFILGLAVSPVKYTPGVTGPIIWLCMLAGAAVGVGVCFASHKD